VLLAVLVLVLLLTVLSPLVAVAAALVFGTSIVALIITAAQKRSMRGWGTVAVASLVLVVATGGISDALYGIGFLASSDPRSNGSAEEPGGASVVSGGEFTSVPAGSASSSAPAAGSEDAGSASGTLPYYEVVYSSPSSEPGGINLEILVGAAPDRYRQDIELVFKDIEAQTQGQYDFVYIIVRNYGGMSVGGTSVVPGQVMLARGYISHTDTGEVATGVPSGSYSIEYYM
jgi:hypothetical protein